MDLFASHCFKSNLVNHMIENLVTFIDLFANQRFKGEYVNQLIEISCNSNTFNEMVDMKSYIIC